MKKYLVLIAVVCMVAATGCKKHHTLPKVPAPAWTVDNTGKYPASMTAVVQVPESLKPYTQAADKMGAFVGDECRGVGALVKVGSQRVFFVLIHGAASEQSKVSFKYWTSWKSNMYQTDAFLDFTVDGAYGTADRPEVLDLEPVK